MGSEPAGEGVHSTSLVGVSHPLPGTSSHNIMPKPKHWTDDDLARRDRCVETMLQGGELPPAETAEQRATSRRSRAYALCTASVERAKKGEAR